jgi:hypothetical protein
MLRRDEGQLLQFLLEDIVSYPTRPVPVTPEMLRTLDRIRSRLQDGYEKNDEQVRKLREAAERQYGGEGDPYEIIFDDLEAAWVSVASGTGAWVSCWAWVPYEDAGLEEDE